MLVAMEKKGGKEGKGEGWREPEGEGGEQEDDEKKKKKEEEGEEGEEKEREHDCLASAVFEALHVAQAHAERRHRRDFLVDQGCPTHIHTYSCKYMTLHDSKHIY